mmetsp:Transcript_2796/g.5153  ORF Transcript_2796/g.5153 Transcript_2796/m.5153 type:complete len:138 (+) Transcript_2796:833-1246(+)
MSWAVMMVCVCTFIHLCVCVCVCVHMHAHTCAHTRTHHTPGAHSSCYESALQSLVGVKVEEGVWEMAVGLPKKGEVIIWGSNAIHGGSGFKHTHRHVNMNTCTHTHAHEMCVHMCTFTHTCVCAHVSRVCVHRHQRS